MNQIKEMLYSLNNCLVDTFNVLLHTNFTRFRPNLPPKVNILRAQIHRNSNIIYHVNRSVNIGMVCPKMYITANTTVGNVGTSQKFCCSSPVQGNIQINEKERMVNPHFLKNTCACFSIGNSD